MQLSDLFAEGSDYLAAISGNILKQMKEQMDAGLSLYWIENEFPEHEFHSIAEDQNFFFADNGNLVIRFDKYEVGPGSSGCPQFEIPREIYEAFLKEGY